MVSKHIGSHFASTLYNPTDNTNLTDETLVAVSKKKLVQGSQTDIKKINPKVAMNITK